jgi:hypothetical protein
MSIDLPLYRSDSAAVDTAGVDLDRFEHLVRSTRPAVNPELWARIWFVLFVGVLAYFVQLSEVGRTAFAGSQSAYLVVAPVLAGLVAAGYSHPPKGVIDAESDWIAAALLCVGGFAAIVLVERRLPTLAALWHIDNLGFLIWVAACGMVVFSARHVLRMWNVWLLGLLLAPVMPFMLMTAQLGGSDTAVALVSALIGTAAVFLATRFVSLGRRVVSTLINLGLSCAAVFLLIDTSLYVRVLVAAGAVPVVVVIVLHRVTSPRRAERTVTTSPLPQCRPQSYAVLLVAAIAMLCLQLPMTRPAPVEQANTDWVQNTGLERAESFPFITRFLGPDSSLVRYRVAGESEAYETVVDVMTSPDLARLQDFSNAIWYPSAVPVNYTPFDAGTTAPAGIKSAHSDADSATTSAATNWDAVTWVWRSGAVFQQVTVLTSQSSNQTAPEPEPLTLRTAFLEPALWTLRQQPSEPGVVSPIARANTESVVRRLLAEQTPAPAGNLAR